MDFGEALDKLKTGERVSRSGWNGKGMRLSLIRADEWRVDGIHNRLPWIGMETATGDFVPWFASQADLLADDWGLVGRSPGP
jgi:hypothetical protein